MMNSEESKAAPLIAPNQNVAGLKVGKDWLSSQKSVEAYRATLHLAFEKA